MPSLKVEGVRQPVRTWLWVILGVALVLRLGWGITRPTGEADLKALPDQREYLELGRNLLHAGTLKFHDDRFDQDVYAYRTPGYPAFVAALGGSVRAVRVAQALVDTSTALAAYLIARRLAVNPRAGLVAAALVALNPLLIYFSGLILSETVFTALLAWGVCLCLTSRTWVLGVACLTLDVLVRPSGAGLALLIPALAAAVNSPGIKSYAIRTAVAIVAMALSLGAWGYRNQRAVGQWVLTTTNEGITRYDGFNPKADGSSNQWFVKDNPRLSDMDEVQRNDSFGTMASSFVRQFPEESARLAFRKIARTWSPMPLSEQFGSAKYVVVGLGYTAPFFLLVAIGLANQRLSRVSKVLLMTPAVYLTVTVALSVGSLRYRVPAEPLMAVIAAVALTSWAGRREAVANQ